MTASNSGVEFHLYRELADIPLDELSWDELVKDANVGGVFLQYFWVSNWWATFGHAYKLYFVTAESSQGVLAFAPLMIDQNGTLRFIGDLNADYLGFVIPAENRHLMAGFVEFLSRSRDHWSTIHLRNICRYENSNQTLCDLFRESRLIPWNNYSVSAPYLQILGNDAELEALFNKYSFRRADRLLRDQGDVTYEVFSTIDRADCFWGPFAQQHLARCKHIGRFSTFSNPNYAAFLKALFESDTNHSRVHFSGLFLSGRPVAFHFGFLSQNRLLWYKPSFDINVTKGSPGLTMTHELIKYAKSNDIAELDFTIGDETFKDRFCSQHRIVDEFRVHQSLPAYIADFGYWRLRQSLKKLRTTLQHR